MNSIRDTSAFRAGAFLLAFSAAALLLAGCGDFWQAPGSGSTGPSTGTATTTTLTPSTSTPIVGTATILTATVSPAAATGTVTFYSNSVSIGSQALTSGTAALSTTFTSAGTDSLTATYGGSSSYATSTSSPVSVTVSAASSSADRTPAAAAHVITKAPSSAAIHAIEAFRAEGGSFTARDAEAVVVEGPGSVSLNGAALSSAAGDGRGVLLEGSTTATNAADDARFTMARFTMVGGSLTYSCSPTETVGCAAAAPARNNPATVFSVAGTTAEISLTDVAITNDTATQNHKVGTLLATSALRNGQHVQFTAMGTAVAGDVAATGAGDVTVRLLQDEGGRGSSLTGAVNREQTGRPVSLVLDSESSWTVTGTSYLTALSGLDVAGRTVNNIDGGGHCVFYSGTVNGSSSGAVYALTGGGFLAPLGTAGLNCD